MSITIDKEFESLIPPLSAEEFQQLEENCVKEGIRDALITWNGILVDGHNRFKIAAKHGLHWNEKRMEFADRDEVKLWIIRNQLGRRNLNSFSRSELAIQGKELIAKKAKEKQAEYHGNQHDGLHQKSDKEQVITAKELGKIAGVSHDTIHKVETIKKSGDEKLIEEVRNGDVSINKGYQIATGKEIKTKSPAVAKQERIDRAKEEHEEFKESKTVSITQVQMDKANRQIIASNLYVRLLNIGKRIEDVCAEMENGDIDIKEMCQTLDTEKIKMLTGMFRTWSNMLVKLDKEVRNN